MARSETEKPSTCPRALTTASYRSSSPGSMLEQSCPHELDPRDSLARTHPRVGRLRAELARTACDQQCAWEMQTPFAWGMGSVRACAIIVCALLARARAARLLADEGMCWECGVWLRAVLPAARSPLKPACRLLTPLRPRLHRPRGCGVCRQCWQGAYAYMWGCTPCTLRRDTGSGPPSSTCN